MTEVPIAATGLLREFCEASMIQMIDFHLARRLAQLVDEADPEVQLALALAARELRLGSACVDLATAPEVLQSEVQHDDGSAASAPVLPWPSDTQQWVAKVAVSPAVAAPGEPARPFRLVGSLLYLERYWQEEQALSRLLAQRSALVSEPAVAVEDIPPSRWGPQAEQDAAVAAAVTHLTSVITGGPGTGKTSIVARILDALAGTGPSVALCAPTGKAAARLHTAVLDHLRAPVAIWSGTIHKLLGLRPRSADAEFNAANPVPYDVVVVDETSMASLGLMRQLLEAIAPSSRLVLLGDPQQLRSVEAGAVLADIEQTNLVREPGGRLTRLKENHRSNQEITTLASAIEAGDVPATRSAVESASTISLIEFDGTTDPISFDSLRDWARASAVAVIEAASRGDGEAANDALERHRILCGHREGPFGVQHWGRTTRRWLAGELDDYGSENRPYVGQPLLILKNSDLFRNGETAVVVKGESGELTAVVDGGDGLVAVSPSLLDDAEDLHAMTIHKSQGSQFDHVSIVLPPVGSPLLTRELIYTAITRAKSGVTLYGSWESLEAAVQTPARRASGLGR